MSMDITSLAVKVTSEGIKEASDKLGGLSTTARNVVKRIDSLTEAMKRLDTVNKNSSGILESYMLKIREQDALLKSMNTNARGAAGGTDALAAAMLMLSNSLNILNINSQRAERSTRGHNEAMREAHALARGLSGSLGALWMTYGNIAGMAVGVAIGASLKGIVSVGKDVEQTLATIMVLGEATTAEVSRMREKVIELGKGTQGPREVAEALSVLTLAGLSASESMTGVKSALDLSIVGGVGVEKAASTLVQVATALGYTADGFSRVGDVVAKTAAVSMASVESISNSFMSAASVGELYGASLTDIGVGLAALSNLGIKGTAAGTSLKNMYKDLASGSDQVTETFNKMHMSIASLKDADGYFIPLIDIIKKVDQGLSNLDGKARQDAMGRLSGERGVKELAALVQMLHKASTEVDEFGNQYANKLEEVQDRIDKSYGFMALGAIVMAQTSENQLKSVGNTIQTVFLKAFQDASPQIGEVTRSLKAAFNSPEFIDGVRGAASLVANLTKFVAEHIDILGTLVKAYIAFKSVEVAASLIKIGLAFDVAAIAAKGFTASLGPIGIAIAALTTLWVLYKNAQADATGDKGAVNSLQEQVKAEKEMLLDRQRVLKGLKDGVSPEMLKMEEDQKKQAKALEANVEAAKTAVEAQEKYVKSLESTLSVQDKLQISMKKANPNANVSSVAEDFLAKQERANTARVEFNALEKQHIENLQTILPTEKAISEIQDKNAKKQRIKPTGTETLGDGSPSKAALNDIYREALKEQEGFITAANNALAAYEKQQVSLFKAGKISKLEVIESTGLAQIAASVKIINALNAQEALANSHKNSKADAQGFHDKAIQEVTDQAARENQVVLDSLEYVQSIRQSAAKLEIKELETKGQFVKAEQLRYENRL